MWGAVRTAQDDWLEDVMLEYDVADVGDVEPTYASVAADGTLAGRSTVDHWLLTAGLRGGAVSEVGAGVDGWQMEALPGKGHNAVWVTIPLDADSGDTGDGASHRATQAKVMSAEETTTFQEEEESAVARALEEATAAEGQLSGKRKVEVIECALHELALRVLQVGEEGEGGAKRRRWRGAEAKMRWWRRVKQWASRLDERDDVMQEMYDGVPEVLGRDAAKDAELMAALRAAPAADRRRRLLHLADARMRAAEEARRKAEGGEADDPDRVATMLMEKLKAAGTRKGSGVWDVFKAVGEARSDLVGVKSRPKRGTPTIAQVTCTTRPVEEGGGRAVVGVRAVAEEVARQAAALHQERGGSAEGMATVYRWLDGVGASGDASDAKHLDTELAGEATRTVTEGEWATLLSDEALDAGRKKFRPVQGVGGDGISGYHLRLAGGATWAAYKAAMRDMGVALARASQRLRQAGTAAEVEDGRRQVREAVPEWWTKWLVILLAKPGRKPDRMSSMRDIYLQPHGLKLFMNGLKPRYDMGAEGLLLASQSGFRRDRDAPEQTMAMSIQQEQAEEGGRPWYRGFIDYSGFFQSIVRRIQEMVEARGHVPLTMTEAVVALHDSLRVAVDTGACVAPAVPSLTGNGQGDTDGPVRSMLMLDPITRAVEQLCAGFRYDMPAGVGATRVPQVWFADDGSFGTDDHGMLRVIFTVVSMVARVAGLEVGIDGEQKGTKTAWHGAEPDGSGGYVECDGSTSVELIDGRIVPLAKGKYKHLGTWLETTARHHATRERVVARCRGIAGMLARLGCLTAAQYVEAVDIAVRSVIMYYGAATPMSRSACERIDRAKRIGLAAMGHRARRSAKWLVHAKEAEGGMGMGLTWAQAGAALVAEVSRVLRRPGTPAYVALTSQIAATYWRLGWRPTKAAPRPLDWWPVHLQGTRALREDYVVESFMAFCLEAGMRTEARGGAGAADAMGSGWWGEPSGSAADKSIWEVEGRQFSWRLAQLGLVTRRDLYGGRDAGGEGRCRECE